MSRRAESPPAAGAALGFRAKTGRAIAVALRGSGASVQGVRRVELRLTDPSVPESAQPYHAALGRRGAEADAIVGRARAAVERTAERALRELVEDLARRGLALRGVGVVGGSLRDPATLGNAHVRAHALEGRLFGEVLERAAAACGTPAITLAQKLAYEEAEARLGCSRRTLHATLSDLGAQLGRPWRRDEKLAALAAWVAWARAAAAHGASPSATDGLGGIRTR